MEEDAQKGLIFYAGFDIFEAARQQFDPGVSDNKPMYSNMLRSQHIPFNFFVPLAKNLVYARDVINFFVGGAISDINLIKIEHAPAPEIALHYRTSFDAYIGYEHVDGTEGILGIEVKYGEGAYPLKEG